MSWKRLNICRILFFGEKNELIFPVAGVGKSLSHFRDGVASFFGEYFLSINQLRSFFVEILIERLRICVAATVVIVIFI